MDKLYLHYPMLFCLQDTPRYSPMSWASSAAYCSRDCSYLLALWLIPYVQCSSLTSLVFAILISWKSSCVWMHTIIHWSLWNHSSGSDVLPDMSWISENQTSIDCPYKSVQLYTHGRNICFWYSLLEIIIPLNLSVKLFRCSYHLVPLHDFFP